MCTSFTIGDQSSGDVYGRTLEFTLPLRSSLVVAPKGLTFTTLTITPQPAVGMMGAAAGTK
jgi:penicillin V acylase-like amidase (Ntn superfamily)